MGIKERLWQVFLAMVVGVTLSVCDGSIEIGDFEKTAIANSGSVESGDGWVKIADLIINYNREDMSNPTPRSIKFNKAYSEGIPAVLWGATSSCIPGSSNFSKTGFDIFPTCSGPETWVAIGR
jgi:hypothetical protein